MTEVTNAKELALLLAGVQIGREFNLVHEGDGLGGMHFESTCGKFTGGLWHNPGRIVVDFADDEESMVPHYALQHIYNEAEITAAELWLRWENAKAEAKARITEGGEA
jgi:hypothetical protein